MEQQQKNKNNNYSFQTKQGKNSVIADSVTYNHLYLTQGSLLGEIFSI